MRNRKLNEDNIFFKNDTKRFKRDKNKIKKCDMISTDAHVCKIYAKKNHIYTNARFLAGDIIEICPVRMISKNALYSNEVRDMAFEVVPNEEYVIPFGYCQHYDIVSKRYPEANCTYEWDAEHKKIIIRAIDNLQKDTILVLDVSEK